MRRFTLINILWAYHNEQRQPRIANVFFAFMLLLFASYANSQSSANAIQKIALLENDKQITLYADGSCNIDGNEKVQLNEAHNNWTSIVERPYIERLSGLAILEEIKQQVFRTRIIMDIDKSTQTQLIIQSDEATQTITLYSVDMMNQTYPQAKLLAHFMDIVKQIRRAHVHCQA